MDKELEEYLQKIASKDTAAEAVAPDDLIIMDVCGGNFDDCYSRGMDDGEILLARNLLDKFFSQE